MPKSGRRPQQGPAKGNDRRKKPSSWSLVAKEAKKVLGGGRSLNRKHGASRRPGPGKSNPFM